MRRPVIPVRQGPGLAEARADLLADGWGMRALRDAPAVPELDAVLVSLRERAAVPDAAMPAGLPGVRDAFAAAGWTWEVGYSRVLTAPVRYAASAKHGRAGQIRKPGAELEIVTLRVRCWWAAAYGRWDTRRWSHGGAVVIGQGWRKLSTVGALSALIEV